MHRGISSLGLNTFSCHILLPVEPAWCSFSLAHQVFVGMGDQQSIITPRRQTSSQTGMLQYECRNSGLLRLPPTPAEWSTFTRRWLTTSPAMNRQAYSKLRNRLMGVEMEIKLKMHIQYRRKLYRKPFSLCNRPAFTHNTADQPVWLIREKELVTIVSIKAKIELACLGRVVYL